MKVDLVLLILQNATKCVFKLYQHTVLFILPLENVNFTLSYTIRHFHFHCCVGQVLQTCAFIYCLYILYIALYIMYIALMRNEYSQSATDIT